MRLYIRKCHACQLNQTRRHLFYDKLMSIITFSTLFHIITMNFILNFFICRDMNCFLILICKVFKSNKLLFDKNTYFVTDWTKMILNLLFIADWNLSRKIIFDRNSKFVFDFWKVIFKILKIKLLIITTYHVQANEQNKRINQTIEIVIRFFFDEKFRFWLNRRFI